MLAWPGLITIAALLSYYVFSIKVGLARSKCGIKPPQMTGDPELERTIRVHENTLEQLVIFVPILWLFALYVSSLWASVLGGIWIIGRILYAWGYYQAAEKRVAGFGISSLSTLVLLVGSIVGIIRSLI